VDALAFFRHRATLMGLPFRPWGGVSNKGSNKVQGLLGSQPLTSLCLPTIFIYINIDTRERNFMECRGRPLWRKYKINVRLYPLGSHLNTQYKIQVEGIKLKWF
jgi:hypothetical protein